MNQSSDTPTTPEETDTPVKHVPLDALHRELDAKMVPFAGYDMPVQYPAGIMAEHNHTRDQASLFDVSHMGQVEIIGPASDQALERLVVGDITSLKSGKTCYTMFTNEQGGILDDLMVTRQANLLYLVINAACKEADIAHLQKHLGSDHDIRVLEDRALLALQGPSACEVLSRYAPAARHMNFMSAATLRISDIDCLITRSGYTGEDGYEISISADAADTLARLLLDEPEVEPGGLGARDSLRLEAGLCLFGNDIDPTTTPIEAGLKWTISKRRREQGGFPGSDIILQQLKDGPPRLRVGIAPQGRAPARAHTEITDTAGSVIGEITSGGFGPTLGGPVAMGYVKQEFSKHGTDINLLIRGKSHPAKITSPVFVKHNYFKG